VSENPALAAQEAFLRLHPGQRDAVDKAYGQPPSEADEGRLLRCTKCGDEVLVHELPGWFLESERFVCGECMTAAQDSEPVLAVTPAAEDTGSEQPPLMSDVSATGQAHTD